MTILDLAIPVFGMTVTFVGHTYARMLQEKLRADKKKLGQAE